MSSLACKYVFYTPEHNVKWEPHGTEFWRSWNAKMKYTNRSTQRVDEKNVIMIT